MNETKTCNAMRGYSSYSALIVKVRSIMTSWLAQQRMRLF